MVSGRGYQIPVVPPEFPHSRATHTTSNGCQPGRPTARKSAVEPPCSKGKCANAVMITAFSRRRILSVQTVVRFCCLFHCISILNIVLVYHKYSEIARGFRKFHGILEKFFPILGIAGLSCLQIPHPACKVGCGFQTNTCRRCHCRAE